MDLSSLKRISGATKHNKRLGRGQGSGKGSTSGKGHKGQRSRSGAKKRSWFEGGQMPIQRRLPKFGFHHHGKIVYQIVNLQELEKVAKETDITPETLKKHGLIKKLDIPVKLLGTGDINKKLNVKVHALSKSAREKIEKAGGVVTLL